MSLSPRSLAQNLALAVVALGLSACGASPVQPHVEVASRKQIPIPVCTTQLGAVKRPASGKSVVRSLDPEQWMSVLVKGYTVEKGLGDKDLDCTDHYLFANESLRGGISAKGWPRPVEIEELDQRSDEAARGADAHPPA